MPSSDRKVNPDLILERKKCNFDIEEFSTWWVGGKSKLDDKRFRGSLFFLKFFIVENKRKFFFYVIFLSFL